MTDLMLSSLHYEDIHEIAVKAKTDLCHGERILTACLLEIDRRQLYFEWGVSTTEHYSEAILKLDGHTAREFMRTGRSLAALPKLAEALYGGRISKSKVREITRVATPETEDFWLDAAEHHNCRQIEMMVARTHKGRKPNEPDPGSGKPRPLKTRVTLDFDPEQMVILREAVAEVNRIAGESVPLADAIELVAQEFLNTAHREEDVGNRYRLVIHADPSNKVAWVNGPRGMSRVSDETLEQAVCDAEVLDLRVGRPTWDADNGDGERVDGAVGRPTWDADDVSAAGAGGDGADSRPTWDGKEGGARRPTWDAEQPDLLDEPSPSVWSTLTDVARGVATRDGATRLTRTVAPSVIRHAMARDQYRCAVPGCEMRIWKELHHLKWWSHGGGHDLENLVVLCTRHHRMIHRGQLYVEGTPSKGLTWRDGYGRVLEGSA